MYNTGNAGWLSAACNPNRTIDTRAVLKMGSSTVSLGTADIVSYKATYASMAGTSFVPGSFVANQLEMSLVAVSTVVSKINFKTDPIDQLTLEAGIKVKDMVYIPMGTFFPVVDGTTVGNDGHVTIKATDLPPALSNVFNSATLALPCTISVALGKISTQLGISIVADPDIFPNLEVSLDETFSLTTTYREALMYFAEVLGAYVTMGRDGRILFKPLYSGVTSIGCTLDESYLFSVKKQESSVKPFQYIGIKANKDDIGVSQEVSGVTTQCQYDILDNPLTYGHPEDFLPGLVSSLRFAEFYPSIISFQGRPDLDVGDVVEYVDRGVVYVLPICSHVFEYNGGFKTTLESIGSDALRTSSGEGGTKSQINALKQNINSLVRDLEKTQSQIWDIDVELVRYSSILQTVDSLSTQVSKLEGDVSQMTTLKQTSDQLRIDIQTLVEELATANATINENQNLLLSYFDFKADGLTIGVNSSNIKLRLANNKIQFLRDENEVAYFSEGQLYVTDANFLRSLIIGNFEFVPRSNGNLSVRKRG